MMNKPIAVLISDVHFSMATLDLATEAMTQAYKKARKLNVDLIVAGDLHDTKANLRGECVNRIIDVNKKSQLAWYVLIGNHDKINEKSEEHALNFLEPYSYVVNKVKYLQHINVYLIPYQHDLSALKTILDAIPKHSTLIMHQGLTSALPGEYTHDKTAAPMEWFAEYRVISGHYHARQDVKCGRPQKGAVGLFSYIGNPYTVSFGEHADPPKGFQVLYDDGSLEFVPTNLRKHVKLELPAEGDVTLVGNPGDLLWIKYSAPRQVLNFVDSHFTKPWTDRGVKVRLDLIPTDEVAVTAPIKALKNDELLDAVIDQQGLAAEQKERLKKLWRQLENS